MTLRAYARQLGIGPWILRNYNRRFPRLHWLLQFGAAGALAYSLGEAAMRRKAPQLPPISADDQEGFSCSFMTGSGHWQQTLFCAHSLGHHAGSPLSVTILDDGTLTRIQVGHLRRVLRGVRVITAAESRGSLDRALPPTRFPLLRDLCGRMPMMRKLVALRAGGEGWRLYLDSDMLFFRQPELLIEHQKTRIPCYMQDRLFAYSLPADTLEAIAGHPIPPCVNAGIVGLVDDRIDWADLERCLRKMPPAGLNAQLLEQTLTAILLGRAGGVVAPGDDYHILYERNSPVPASPVLLHYIYHAKLRYFSRDWKSHARRVGPG